MIIEEIIDESNLKSHEINGKKFYYHKNELFDEALNSIEYIHKKGDAFIKEIQRIYNHMYGLVPTFKDLVFNKHAHGDYWEKDMKTLIKDGIIPFPVQRRGNMKDSFFNTESSSLFSKDIFELIDMCENKKEFKITFSKSLLPKKYVLFSFQLSKSGKQTYSAGCLLFVKKELYEANKKDLSKLANLAYDMSEDDDYDEDATTTSDRDFLFVVTTGAVEDALDALFSGNKSMVRGYKNKKIKIF